MALLAALAWSGLASAALPPRREFDGPIGLESERPYPADLPSTHWAYDIARRLAQRGILKGFPDSTFRGNAPVNRYQLAIAIHEALAQLENRLDRIEASRPPPSPPEASTPPQVRPAGDDEFPGLRRTRVAPPAAAGHLDPMRGGVAIDPDDDPGEVASAPNGDILSAAERRPPPLSPADSRALALLTREFSRELSTLRLRTRALEERQRTQRKDLDVLRTRVDDIVAHTHHEDAFRFRAGELRLVGFVPYDLRSFTNLIVDFHYRINERISGTFAPQATVAFDSHLDDKLDIWEAYADFADYGFVSNARVGRQLLLLGPGLTLFDRIETFNFTGTYADTFMQVLLLGDIMFLAETRLFSDQTLGFYYFEEQKNPLGQRPVHLGSYVKGKFGTKLTLGLEYANYSNRVQTPFNNNIYTNGYLADLIWEPSPAFRLRAAAIAAEEDFRAVSIDRDLAYHSPVSSPLEDVLQTLSQATREYPFPVARNEINGFWDAKLGVDFDIPDSRFRLGFDWDRVRDYSILFNNARNGFDVLGARLKRSMGGGSWLEVRARKLMFENPDPLASEGTLGIPRVDRSDVRVQWFGRF